ncbi:MAG: 50S ribosomal protein L24 [Aigarchaeota archaeon]|nr:50S ribosomal protein L24 [Aigarchaeota archaeon]MDW8092206.1 50S ribosomal protein L24 [Nitrososphaerota archaeon]
MTSGVKVQRSGPGRTTDLRSKSITVHLSVTLREKYRCRSLPARVGDTVKVMRGEYRGVEGKIIRVDRSRGFVYIEGLTRKKADGTNVNVPVHASNTMLMQLNLDDEYRKKSLDEGAAKTSNGER